jgi:hypothetical protein
MTAPWVRVVESDGSAWDDPPDNILRDLLRALDPENPFVIVERMDLRPPGQNYMQVYFKGDGSYQVEFRDGGAERHYESQVAKPDKMTDVIADYALDRPGWRDSLKWTRCALDRG